MNVPPARVVFSPDDRDEIARTTADILATGALTLGQHTQRFEADFAALHRVENAVAVASGTAALEIALRCLDVEGRAVVVPANTFFATAAAVLHAGGRPVFADVDAATLMLSPATLERALQSADDVAAAVLVHIGGTIPASIDELSAVCERHGIALVEDAAHAHGSTFDGRPAGTFGRVAAFSFYPTKVITSGEGGMLVTGDEAIAQRARVFRDQGKAGFIGNLHVELGYAWRMSEVHAAIGEVHLRRLPEFLTRRREVARAYDAALAGSAGLEPLVLPDTSRSNYYKYIALLPPGVDRQLVKKHTREQFGVGLSGEVYELPLHRQPVFEPWANGPLPVAEDVCARHICLPLHSDMTDDEVALVVESVGSALDELWEGDRS